jgi:hypothetical protein
MIQPATPNNKMPPTIMKKAATPGMCAIFGDCKFVLVLALSSPGYGRCKGMP